MGQETRNITLVEISPEKTKNVRAKHSPYNYDESFRWQSPEYYGRLQHGDITYSRSGVSEQSMLPVLIQFVGSLTARENHHKTMRIIFILATKVRYRRSQKG